MLLLQQNTMRVSNTEIFSDFKFIEKNMLKNMFLNKF